jgi:hypothetical protein
LTCAGWRWTGTRRPCGRAPQARMPDPRGPSLLASRARTDLTGRCPRGFQKFPVRVPLLLPRCPGPIWRSGRPTNPTHPDTDAPVRPPPAPPGRRAPNGTRAPALAAARAGGPGRPAGSRDGRARCAAWGIRSNKRDQVASCCLLALGVPCRMEAVGVPPSSRLHSPGPPWFLRTRATPDSLPAALAPLHVNPVD